MLLNKSRSGLPHKVKTLLCLGLLLGVTFPVVAQESAPLWAHEQSDLAPDPAVVWGQLDNGIRYAILPNSEPPGRVSLRLLIEAGSLMETDVQQGIAHYLEHLAFNGSENFPPGELVKLFERLGLGFGADTNAHTSFDETVYKFELPSPEAEHMDPAFQALADYARGLLLLPEEIEQERGVILSEMRDGDSPQFRAVREAFQFALPYAKIPRRFPIGTAETVRALQPEDFRDFYDTWYTPDRMAVVVVGDLPVERAREYIQKYFAELPPNPAPLPDPDIGAVLRRGEAYSVYVDTELSLTEVGIATVREVQPEPDTAAQRFAALQLAAATDMLNRRLEELAKLPEAPFSRAASYTYRFVDFAEFAGIYAEMSDTSRWPEALEVISQELRRAVTYGFTEAELAVFKAQMLNALQTAAAQAATRESRMLSSALVDTISEGDVFTSPQQELELTAPQVEALTPDLVQAALAELWAHPDRLVRLEAHQPVEEGYTRLISAYRAAQALPVEPPEEQELAAFAYSDFGPPGEIVERRELDALDAWQVRFANGVVLSLKRTEFERQRIGVAVAFGHGELTLPEGQEGLGFFANYTFTQGGLEAHSQDELQKILAGKNVGASFAAEEEAFVLRGVTTPDDLLTQLQLLTAYMVAPGYREEAERRFRQFVPQVYQQLNHTVDGVVRKEVTAYLANGDRRFGLPEQEVMAQRNLAELQNWLAEPLRQGLIEVAVVGDLDPEAVIQAVAATLGALPDRAVQEVDLAAAREVSHPAPPAEESFGFTTQIPKARVMGFWPTVDRDDIRLDRRLSVLSGILDLRLVDAIREELGAAYSPYAYHRASDVYDDYGFLTAVADVEPSQVPAVAELMRELGATLAAEGPTEDEFDRVLTPRLRQLEEQFRDNAYWLNRVLLGSYRKPHQLDWARTLFTDYPTITFEEIQKLAQTYLPADNLILVRVAGGPAPEDTPAAEPAAAP